MLKALDRNLRFSLRLAAKQPTRSLWSILTLSLGIGLGGLSFAVYYGSFLRDLPLPESERFVRVTTVSKEDGAARSMVPYFIFENWKQSLQSVSSMGAFRSWSFALSDSVGVPQRYKGAFVSSGFFEAVGVAPLAGRDFSSEDLLPSSPRVAAISYELWTRRYDQSDRILGSKVQIFGQEHTITAILPEGMRFPVSQDLWFPIEKKPDYTEPSDESAFEVFARLKPDATASQAQAELSNQFLELESAFPEHIDRRDVQVLPYVSSFYSDGDKKNQQVLLAATLALLLLATFSTANLLLSRVVARLDEILLRKTLGAQTANLVQLILAEAVVHAAAAGLLGLGICKLGIDLFNEHLARNTLFWQVIELDLATCMFVGAITLFSLGLATVLPVLWVTTVGESAGRSSRGSRSVTGGLVTKLGRASVALQVGLAVVLATLTGWQLRNLQYIFENELGLIPAEIATTHVNLSGPGTEAGEYLKLFQTLETELGRIPGMQSVGLAFPALPSDQPLWRNITSPASTNIEAWMSIVSIDYFETLGVAPREGRLFTNVDAPDSEMVAVVNESLARHPTFGSSALGKVVKAGGVDRRIVGIVDDLQMGGLGMDNTHQGIYLPFTQVPTPRAHILFRSTRSHEEVASEVLKVGARLFPDKAFTEPIFLGEHLRNSTRQYWLTGSVLGSLSALTVLMTGIGILGAVNFWIGRQKRAIGIKAALGASPPALLLDVLAWSLRTALPGFLVAVPALVWSRDLLRRTAYNPDLMTWSLAVLVGLGVASAVALLTLVPAFRASRAAPAGILNES